LVSLAAVYKPLSKIRIYSGYFFFFLLFLVLLKYKIKKIRVKKFDGD